MAMNSNYRTMIRPQKYSYPVTPAEFSSGLLDLCQELISDGSQPVYVENRPNDSALVRDCFQNVAKQVAISGGESVTGWAIREFPNWFIEAEFHAVWRSPDGELLDLTPMAHPTARILFLHDPVRTYQGKQINNVRKALTRDADIAVYLKTFDDMFGLLNQGDRASVVGELILEGQDAIEFRRLEASQAEAWAEMSQRLPAISAYGPCWCGSGIKVRWCHGKP